MFAKCVQGRRIDDWSVSPSFGDSGCCFTCLHLPRQPLDFSLLAFTFSGTVVSHSRIHCPSIPTHTTHSAEGIPLQLPEAVSKGALFACVLKMEMIIIKDVRRIISEILSRSAH